jgi:hypothetical protein
MISFVDLSEDDSHRLVRLHQRVDLAVDVDEDRALPQLRVLEEVSNVLD